MSQETLYLTLTGPIEDAPVAQLIQFLEATIDQQGIDHLYLAINTPGGSVSAGIAFYHYLKGVPIKVTTHNIGQVDSIGNVIFLAGEERVASSATSFLLHGVSLTVIGPAQLSKAQLQERLSQIKQDEARIRTITAEKTKLSATRLTSFYRTGRSLSPTEAKECGIVTHIREFEIPNGAKRGVVNTFPIPNQGNVTNSTSL